MLRGKLERGRRGRGAASVPHLLAPVEKALPVGAHAEALLDLLAERLDLGEAAEVFDGLSLGTVDGADLDPHGVLPLGVGGKHPGPRRRKGSSRLFVLRAGKAEKAGEGEKGQEILLFSPGTPARLLRPPPPASGRPSSLPRCPASKPRSLPFPSSTRPQQTAPGNQLRIAASPCQSRAPRAPGWAKLTDAYTGAMS